MIMMPVQVVPPPQLGPPNDPEQVKDGVLHGDVVCSQELARERQENLRLLKGHQDKDDLIGKLKEEIDLLNRVSPAHAHVFHVSQRFLCVLTCGRHEGGV